MKDDKHMMNLLETHFEIVAAITRIMDGYENDIIGINTITLRHTNDGYAGLYDLAREWTLEFERDFEGVEWGVDLDFLDTIKAFIRRKIKW